MFSRAKFINVLNPGMPELSHAFPQAIGFENLIKFPTFAAKGNLQFRNCNLTREKKKTKKLGRVGLARYCLARIIFLAIDLSIYPGAVASNYKQQRLKNDLTNLRKFRGNLNEKVERRC